MLRYFDLAYKSSGTASGLVNNDTLDGVTSSTSGRFSGAYLNTPTGTANTLVAHTNTAQISTFASAAWMELNKPKPQSPGIHQAAENAAKVTELEDRLKALKKIKAAQRTPEQKAEIDELEEKLEELTNK